MALANRQDEIRAAHGELITLYYFDVSQQISVEPFETSEMMDSFGWRGGWMFKDTKDMTLLTANGDGGDQQSVFFPRFPITYVIETATMKIYDGEKSYDYDFTNDPVIELDPLSVVQEIDEKN